MSENESVSGPKKLWWVVGAGALLLLASGLALHAALQRPVAPVSVPVQTIASPYTAAPETPQDRPRPPPKQFAPGEQLPVWARSAPADGKPRQPVPHLEFSAHPPDDNSKTLALVLDITKPSPAQEVQIRTFWKQHEDARRAVLGTSTNSPSTPEVVFADKLRSIDGEFEMNLVSKILEPAQRELFLEAIGHSFPAK